MSLIKACLGRFQVAFACLFICACYVASAAQASPTENEITESADSTGWIEDAISIMQYIEKNNLVIRDDSYAKYESLIENSSGQEKLDRLYQFLIDSTFVKCTELCERFRSYYVAEIISANSKEHRDSYVNLKLAKEGVQDWAYAETIQKLEDIAANPDVHPFAAIRALGIAGYLYGYSGDKDRIVTTITKMEALTKGQTLTPYVAKEINGLKEFSAHFTNDPQEVVRLNLEALEIAYETKSLVYGDVMAGNLTHLVMNYGDQESFQKVDDINRRIAHMTNDDKVIFRAYVLCVEFAVRYVDTERALECLKQAETYQVANSESDVRYHLFGIIALARDGQTSEAKKHLAKLDAIPEIDSSAYYHPNIEWAMSELKHADGQYKVAYAELRAHFNKKLLEQKLEIGEVSRAMRQYSEEKSSLLHERAENLLYHEALQERVINRQKLLIMMASLLVSAMLVFVYVQMKNGRKLKRAQEEMNAANKAISLEARTDQLTRIGNRRAFYEYCQKLKNRKWSNVSMALLDLDGFKAINDTYGHEIGDEIIKATASRLEKSLSSIGRVFRMGGDEMAMVFHSADDADFSAFKMCIEEGLLGPVQTPLRDFELSWSVGITRCKDSSMDPMLYLKRADFALYEAKRQQGNCFHIFSAANLQMMQREYMMPDEILWNLEHEELLMFGQVIVDTSNEGYRPYGIESLLRAQTRDGTPIPPEVFIKHAVSMGKANELTELTLSKSLDMLEVSGLDCPLLFNLSREQIRTPEFPNNILNILKARGFPMERMILELSERTLKNDLKSANRKLMTLQKKGVRIALDDFGSENAGFSTLFGFKFDIIKTDRNFLRLARRSQRSRLLLEHLIQFGQKMNVTCIIEGTENQQEVSLVKNLGGDLMQGYFFGRPEELPKFRQHIEFDRQRVTSGKRNKVQRSA